MNATLRKLDDPTRRNVLACAAKTFLGVSLLPGGAFASGNGSAKRVIYLFMEGGMSHLDTFDPKPENKEAQGPVKAIGTNVDGIRVTEYLPRLAKQMHHIALLRTLSHSQGNHEPGQYKFRTGQDEQPGILHPALGAWVSRLSEKNNPNLPKYVRVGDLANHPASGFMEVAHAPLPIAKAEDGLSNSALPEGVDEERFRRNLDLSRQLDRAFIQRYDTKNVRAYNDFYEDAVAMMSSKDLDAFDLKKEPGELRQAYGDHPFARGVVLARRLVERGVNFVEVDLGGWDSHTDNHKQVSEQAEILDRALSQLLQDLEARGMLADTLVVLGTEFGRTAEIDQFLGRNHFPFAYSCLMAGGGVRGGQVVGQTSGDGMKALGDPITVNDFNATIAAALGLDAERTFSPNVGGQKFSILGKDTDPKKGAPIPGVLG